MVVADRGETGTYLRSIGISERTLRIFHPGNVYGMEIEPIFVLQVEKKKTKQK